MSTTIQEFEGFTRYRQDQIEFLKDLTRAKKKECILLKSVGEENPTLLSSSKKLGNTNILINCFEFFFLVSCFGFVFFLGFNGMNWFEFILE